MKKILVISVIALMLFWSGKAMALSVTTTNDGTALTNEILGTGITLSNISYIGGATQAGLFSGGLSSGIGIESGIILTSGNAADAVGPNTSDDATTVTGTGSNAELNAHIPQTTFDQNVLSFDFESDGGNLFFNYVFASEEYNEFTNTTFNDVFAFIMDGTNIALLPAGADLSNGTAVSINSVNGGNPFGVSATNPNLFNNNDTSDGGPFFDLEYDGFTNVFIASAFNLSAGLHTISLAIADAGDSILDSAVFIQGGSFSDTETPTEPVPEPGTILLMGLGLVGLVGAASRKKFKMEKK